MSETAIIASGVDLVGYLAAGMVLLTFVARSMVSLRLFALSSNLLFVIYAALSGLTPILVLHVILIPVNVLRLWEVRGGWSTGMKSQKEAGRLARPGSPSNQNAPYRGLVRYVHRRPRYVRHRPLGR